MNAKYYVLARTLWQGDNWGAIAGSFSDKAEANSVAISAENNGFNEYGQQNLKYVVNTLVVNTTTMKRVYGIRKDEALEQIAYVEEQQEQQADDFGRYEQEISEDVS